MKDFTLVLLPPTVFELKNPEGAITRVYVTTTGDKVYGTHPREIGQPMFACEVMAISGYQGFILNFLVGVGKNMCIEPRPLGGCGAMLPQEILEILGGGGSQCPPPPSV